MQDQNPQSHADGSLHPSRDSCSTKLLSGAAQAHRVPKDGVQDAKENILGDVLAAAG